MAIDEVSFIGRRLAVAEQAQCADAARRTVAVLSVRYLESDFRKAEGITALSQG